MNVGMAVGVAVAVAVGDGVMVAVAVGVGVGVDERNKSGTEQEATVITMSSNTTGMNFFMGCTIHASGEGVKVSLMTTERLQEAEME